LRVVVVDEAAAAALGSGVAGSEEGVIAGSAASATGAAGPSFAPEEQAARKSVSTTGKNVLER
jgi:hypothetical protein